MRKLLARRPSAGVIIGFIALCVALGGGAYAATKKKIEYKGLSKDARLKVLPVSATNAGGSDSGGTDCNPSTTFTGCTSVSLQTSTAFPRKILLIFDGTFKAVGAPSSGECRLQIDNDPANGTATKIDVPSTSDPKSYGINIVAKPTTGGTHTYSANCKENSGDLKVTQFELSAATVR